jgi:hypothetical protein
MNASYCRAMARLVAQVSRLLTSHALIGLVGAIVAAGANAAPIDLKDPGQLAEAYSRAFGDTSGRDVVSYGHGTVFGVVPGERGRPLFNLEVLSVARFEKVEGGYLRIHREIGFYTDLKTGAVIERWRNPYIDRDVEVIPIQNDPVNRRFVPATVGNIKVDELGDDIVFTRETLSRRPNPLTREKYARYSTGEFIESVELYQTFVSRKALERRTTFVPSIGSWSRSGPWLPWMEMGQHQGYLLYHSRIFKLANGLDGVPATIREYVAAKYPKYLTAPASFVEQDESSWSFFKKVLDERAAAAAAPGASPSR